MYPENAYGTPCDGCGSEEVKWIETHIILARGLFSCTSESEEFLRCLYACIDVCHPNRPTENQYE